MDLQSTLFIEYPSIDRLSKYIASLLCSKHNADQEMEREQDVVRETNALENQSYITMSVHRQRFFCILQNSSNFRLNMDWIDRIPVAVKSRLFCFPYAGEKSERVYGR
jgi:hypothetical protein